MSYYQEDPAKQLNINVSVGINNAAVLAAATDNPFQTFNEIVEDVVRAVLLVQAQFAAEAGLGATTAPATVQAPAPAPSNVVPFQPQAAPAAIPGVADGDPQVTQLWNDFLMAYDNGRVARDWKSANVGQWFDNRAGRTGNSPHFKIKGEKGQNTPGLWTNDKKNSSWVPAALAQRDLS